MDEEYSLTATEYNLLKIFVESKGTILTRDFFYWKNFGMKI